MSPTMSWRGLIGALIRRESLSSAQAAWAMNEIMEGAATPVQVAGFGVALRMKGETAAELAGLSDVMLRRATPISVPGSLVDLVGTGGDGAHTVNISTMGAIAAAGAGARVVKHGNRAASSACGSADVLEALGVVIDLPPEATARLAAETGIAFLFAPLYHPSFRHASVARSELGVPTVFNFLGPVSNPARPGAQAVGVSDPRMGEVIAGVLAGRDCSALVFHGDDGLDELTTTTTSTVWVVHGGAVDRAVFDPAVLGLGRASAGATCAAVTGSTTRRWPARSWPGRAARSATPSFLTQLRRWPPRRGAGRRRAGQGARRGLRPGRGRRQLRGRPRPAGPVGGGQPGTG